MQVEVVAIGTELLLGEIQDTNSAWIGEQLALNGMNCAYQTKVGDNLDRMIEVLNVALSRNDAVICCGGLGPTQDDLTRQAIAAVMGVELVFDAEKADQIRHMFGSRGREMPDNNLTQALLPVGARWIEQQPGTAAGLRCPVTRDGSDKVVYAVPGVPWEMQEMVSGDVLSDLRSRSSESAVIVSRTLRTWGQSESGLAEMLDDHFQELAERKSLTIAFLASGIEGLKVRLTAKAADQDGANELLAEHEARVRRLLGDLVFGTDDETMESVVCEQLSRCGLMLGVAESMKGGLIASRLVAVPGASQVFTGGVVAYDTRIKRQLLGVGDVPVISAECAEAMATGVRQHLGTDVGLGITGVAGPGTQEGRPVGTVCIAADVQGEVSSIEVRLPGRRQQIREFSCITALNLLRTRLAHLQEAPAN